MFTKAKLVLIIPVLLLFVSCKSANVIKGYEHGEIASVSSAGDFISIEITDHTVYVFSRENVSLRLLGTAEKPSVHVFGLDNSASEIHAEILVSSPQEYNSWFEFISNKDKSPRQKIL